MAISDWKGILLINSKMMFLAGKLRDKGRYSVITVQKTCKDLISANTRYIPYNRLKRVLRDHLASCKVNTLDIV